MSNGCNSSSVISTTAKVLLYCILDTYMALQKEFATVLKSFTKEELQMKILPDLTILNWNRIKRKIVNEHMSLSKENIIAVIIDKLLNLENEEQTEILRNLYILGVILHNHKYKWDAIQLIGEESICYWSSYELQGSIKRELLREGTRGEVTVKLDAGFYWIRIVERKLLKNRGIITQPPVCMVVVGGNRYMFVQSSRYKEHIVLCVARALGINRTKHCQLKGKNLKSLLGLLKAKEGNACSTKRVIKELNYQQDPPRKSDHGMDFMQHNSRHNYCKEMFTNDENEMPQLEEMVVQVNGISCNVGHIVPEMEGEPFSMEITFRSTSIAQMFTEMAALGAISTPLPEYANIPALGKNAVEVKME